MFALTHIRNGGRVSITERFKTRSEMIQAIRELEADDDVDWIERPEVEPDEKNSTE